MVILGDAVAVTFDWGVLIELEDSALGLLLAGLSIAYFAIVILAIILRTSSTFSPQPFWLLIETIISIVFCILAFAVLYRFLGISYDGKCPNDHKVTDYIYFSTVTFSTLGYGDFRPCEPARLYAAFHAIFGNMHLGMIVGSAFFLASAAQEEARESDPN